MNTERKTPLESFQSWIKHSIMLKLVTITILMLLLLIPTSMIKSIINERERLNDDAIREVSSKWANEQQINGPVLSIPIIYEAKTKDGINEWTEYHHLLPEALNIDGYVNPQKLKRGIYEIVVYKSQLNITGSFIASLDIEGKNLKEIKTGDAFLTIGVSDLRGIEDQIFVKWNKQNLEAQPGTRIPKLIPRGVTIELPDIKDANKPFDFTFELKLQGSHDLSFVPLGSTTQVSLESSWPSPSFNGQFLPDDRKVSSSGFEANWKVLQLNRNFPQSWTGSLTGTNLSEAAFGVDLILPLDDYQKSIRSAKYAVMTIALSFLVFFLVEIVNKRKIHPFQYTLVGLSLCLFYTLLVSISEHSDFNLAYLISSSAVTFTVVLYSLSIFHSRNLSLLLGATLIGIYGFLFVTLQLADYALLMGSIGLMLILASTMYFTRKINWYAMDSKSSDL